MIPPPVASRGRCLQTGLNQSGALRRPVLRAGDDAFLHVAAQPCEVGNVARHAHREIRVVLRLFLRGAQDFRRYQAEQAVVNLQIDFPQQGFRRVIPARQLTGGLGAGGNTFAAAAAKGAIGFYRSAGRSKRDCAIFEK